MKILFVENHALFAETVVSEFLSGYSVETCATVADAMESIRKERFDIVLVDYDLDDEKGDELVRRLRAQHFTGRIVAVSARVEGNEAMMRAGADSYCRKADFAEIRDHFGDRRVG